MLHVSCIVLNMAVKIIETDNFQQEVLSAQGIVFVDFHAEWCGPCKMTSPLIESLSETDIYKDKIKFVSVDVDHNQELSSRYQVFSIPTFIAFKNGEVINHFVGARDRAGFESELNKSLSS